MRRTCSWICVRMTAIHPLLAAPVYAGGMLHLVPDPDAAAAARALCRGAGAAGEHPPCAAAGRSVRRRAGFGRDDDERSRPAWTDAGKAKRRCFDAARRGLVAPPPPGSKRCSPSSNAAASRTKPRAGAGRRDPPRASRTSRRPDARPPDLALGRARFPWASRDRRPTRSSFRRKAACRRCRADARRRSANWR